MRLSDKEYYRNIGVVNREKYSEEDIVKIVRKSYEALPKLDKEFIPNPELTINSTINTILHDPNAKTNPFLVFTKIASSNRRGDYYGTKRTIWEEFKIQRSSIYYKYNSYMYRIGEKATRYYFDNADVIQHSGQIWEVILELPVVTNRKKVYRELTIKYDFSSGDIMAVNFV
jgi:hypothetical protein